MKKKKITHTKPPQAISAIFLPQKTESAHAVAMWNPTIVLTRSHEGSLRSSGAMRCIPRFYPPESSYLNLHLPSFPYPLHSFLLFSSFTTFLSLSLHKPHNRSEHSSTLSDSAWKHRLILSLPPTNPLSFASCFLLLAFCFLLLSYSSFLSLTNPEPRLKSLSLSFPSPFSPSLLPHSLIVSDFPSFLSLLPSLNFISLRSPFVSAFILHLPCRETAFTYQSCALTHSLSLSLSVCLFSYYPILFNPLHFLLSLSISPFPPAFHSSLFA